ncbi:uncharacterized protein METZ01_LOCUS227602 [marine metagenome]|uniref:Uncharacterized protein n=1 Tax=marine metagenome TaxID=408172 RepID=A0A382GHT5_9ZZZZ
MKCVLSCLGAVMAVSLEDDCARIHMNRV